MRKEYPQMLYVTIKTVNVCIFLMIFFIIYIFYFSEIKNRFTSDFLYSTSVKIPSEIFLNLMSNEIALLGESDISKSNNHNKPSFSEIISMTVFVLWHKDITTFFGNELPGIRAYNKEIVFAGIGTNFTNLPYESAPPIEVLQKEREIAAKELEESNQPSNESNNPPPQGTEEEAVFIYHSHSWEAFLPLLNGVTNPNEAVSFNESKNIIDVGKNLQQELIKKGIGPKHSTTNTTEELKKRIGIIIILMFCPEKLFRKPWLRKSPFSI